MLGIIGLVLKIILFIILGILGLLLLIIAVVLWVPFRYKLIGEIQESAHAEGSVSWLFGLVRVVFDYQDKVSYQVKVLFFTVVDSEKEAVDHKKKASKPKKSNQTIDRSEVEKKPQGKSLEEKFSDDPTMTVKQPEDKEKAIEPQLPESEETIETKSQEHLDENQDKSIKENQQEPLDEMDSGETMASKKLKSKGKEKNKSKRKGKAEPKTKEKSKLETVQSAWQQFKAIWQDPAYDGVIKFILGNIYKLLKSILPKTIRGDIIFGTGDPATTGYIFGGISLFYGVTRDKFIVTPDFMEKVFLGRITIKGRVFLGVLVYYSIRIYLDKRVRKLIKVIRKNSGTN